MLVFLVAVHKDACYYEYERGERQADESGGNRLKEIIGIVIVEREFHHADDENERVVHPVAASEDKERFSDDARVVVHEWGELLCRDYKPRDYKADWDEPV